MVIDVFSGQLSAWFWRAKRRCNYLKISTLALVFLDQNCALISAVDFRSVLPSLSADGHDARKRTDRHQDAQHGTRAPVPRRGEDRTRHQPGRTRRLHWPWRSGKSKIFQAARLKASGFSKSHRCPFVVAMDKTPKPKIFKSTVSWPRGWYAPLSLYLSVSFSLSFHPSSQYGQTSFSLHQLSSRHQLVPAFR